MIKRASYISACFIVFLSSILFAQKKTLLSYPFRSEIKKGSVRAFLEEINNRSGINIEYASNSLDVDQIIELDGDESSVGSVLQKVLNGQHTRLLEKNNKLILVKSEGILNTDELVPVYTFYGFVTEMNSKEPLPGATVMELGTRTGIATNPYGYFSLSLPEGKHRIVVSHVGYSEYSVDVVLKNNTRADIILPVKEETEMMQAIVVPGNDKQKHERADRIGSDEYGHYNYLLGENDLLRSAYLLPGVKNIPSSFSGMFVRGGGSDENLFLMDGNVVYNPTHMMGALSIVNQTSVKSVHLYKSDFPSKYGGAASSVMDIYTKDGNMQQWHGEMNVGILSGSATVEGPLIKNKTAIMTSYRHSWISPLFSAFQKSAKPKFYDFHFKATQLLNRNNKLMINFYNGNDELVQSTANTDNLHQWGNLTGSMIWNRTIGSKSFVNTSVNMSRYKNLGAFKYTLYDDDDDGDDDNDDNDGGVLQSGSAASFTSTEQYNVKSQFEIFLSRRYKLNLGIQLAHTIIRPFDTKFSAEIEDDEKAFTSFEPLPYHELSAYGEGEVRLSRSLFVRPGLHFSVYQFRNYHYYSYQPRFFASYKLKQYQQLFVSYNKMTQYLHLVTNPYLGINADIWLPSTSKLRPEQSDSYNLGYEFNNGKGWKTALEGYWKSLRNVTNYAEGSSYFDTHENWEENIIAGKGCAYGIEWMLNKTHGRLTMLTAYTLSWSWRRFAGINQGQKFPYRYDRRHVINIGVGYKIAKTLQLSALWTFSSGDAFSLPDYIYPDFDNTHRINNPEDLLRNYRFMYHYPGYNRYRSAPYHRLDGAVNYHTDKTKKFKLNISAGVYNIYHSADQYQYELKASANNKVMIWENGYKTFDMMPYLSIGFKF